MANAWVEHIKRFAREKGMTYGCALSDPECKATYKKPPKPLTQKKERESMGVEDASAKAIVAEEKAKKSAHKARTTTMKAKVNKKQVEKQLVETMGMKGEDKDALGTPSQSVPEPAKKKGGRPKKYATAEEAREAKRLMTKESDKRRKEAKKATAKATAPITPAEAKELRELKKELLDKKKATEGKGLKGGSGATDFFNKIGNAFKSRFDDQGSPQERQATSVILNKIEPALIKPLQVLAPPVGDIAEAQREGLKQHYGLGLAKKRGRPPKVVGGATPDQMGLSSVLRTYTRDEIFFALNDITHSADSLPTLANKWDRATGDNKKQRGIEDQIKEILQNPYRITDAKGDILLTDPDNKARETLRKAVELIFGSTTLPPVISKSLRTFKLSPKLEATLPKRQPPTPAQIQNAIQDNLPPPSAKATTPPSPATTSSATTPPTPAPSTLKATATAFVPPAPAPAPAPSLMDFAKVKKAKPAKGKGLNAGYSAEADNGLGHIYPISHDLILRMCEHLV